MLPFPYNNCHLGKSAFNLFFDLLLFLPISNYNLVFENGALFKINFLVLNNTANCTGSSSGATGEKKRLGDTCQQDRFFILPQYDEKMLGGVLFWQFVYCDVNL